MRGGVAGGGHVFFRMVCCRRHNISFLSGEGSKRFAVVCNKPCQFPLPPRAIIMNGPQG